MDITLAGEVTVAAPGGQAAEPLRVRGPQVRLVLAVLVLERRRGISRDGLADVLWPDGVPSSWSAALRGAVSRARSCLAGATPGYRAPIVMRDGRYLLDLPAVSVDVEVAERRLAESRQATAAGDHRSALQLATGALECLQAPFLPGCEGPWVTGRRLHLAELAATGLEVVSQAAVGQGDEVRAVAAAGEAVSRQPLRESAHRCLMAAHAAAGNRGEALRAYERIRQLLAEELGVDPAPETESLYLGLLGPPRERDDRRPPEHAGRAGTGGRELPHQHDGASALEGDGIGRVDRPTDDGRGRLPAPTTSFVGRRRECGRILDALSGSRLVTVTGEAGIGKTRLAYEAARQARLGDHPDGVRFCDLSSLAAADVVLLHVAAAVGVPVPDDAGDARRRLVRGLCEAEMLLVLDGCDRWRELVAELADELDAAGTRSRLLVTSRAPLRVPGEQVVPLGPLPLAASVELLADRARAAGARMSGDSAALVEIARRLDGIPLAVELAGPRLAAMPATALAGRLDRPLELLTGGRGSPAHHRSMRAALHPSFDQLPPEDAALLGALSVFRDGWSLEGAEAVAPAVGVPPDGVALLVGELADRSVVRVLDGAGGSARYRLSAPMEALSAEALAGTGRGPAVRDHHARHVIALVEEAVRHRRGPREAEWVQRVELDHENVRAAHEWSIASGRPGASLRLIVALADDVMMRDRLEVGHWAEELVGHPAVADDPRLPAALAVASSAALAEGRVDRARQLGIESVRLEGRIGAPPCWIARNTLALLAAVGAVADPDGLSWYRQLEVVAEDQRAAGDPLAAAVLHYDRALGLVHHGAPEAALDEAAALLGLAIEHANPSMLAMGLHARGVALGDQDPDMARHANRHALEVATGAHNTLIAQRARRSIEQLNARSGDRIQALRSLSAQVRHFETSGNLCEQVGVVITMLEPLVAVGAFGPAATICAALAGTPWLSLPTCRRLERTVAERLSENQYQRARRTGAAMTLPALVAFARGHAEADATDGHFAQIPRSKNFNRSPEHSYGP